MGTHWTQDRSATDRMHAARSAHLETRTRELIFVAICSRIWPAFLAPPKRADDLFPLVLHLESPAGRIIYRVSKEEQDLFSHITDRRNEPDPTVCTQADKLSKLQHLAMEGW